MQERYITEERICLPLSSNEKVNQKNKKWPLVSVVVLNYNGKYFIKKCLQTVFATIYPSFEVIFVDNASTDDSVEIVKKNYPSSKIIVNTENLHFTEGNNIGLRVAKGEYVVLLNNDTEVHPRWLNEIVNLMESDPAIGACQCKLLFMDNPNEIDSAGGLVNPLGLCVERGKGEKDIQQYDRIDEIFHGKGAALVLRKKVLSEIGLLDRQFLYNSEDIDLCWRLHLRGYKVYFCPKAEVYHSRSSPTKKKFQQQDVGLFHSAKNVLRMLIKNYSVPNLLKFVPLLVSFEIGASLLLLSRRKNHMFFAIIQALLWNLKNLNNTLAERSIVQQKIRKVSDGDVLKHMMSIRADLNRPEFL